MEGNPCGNLAQAGGTLPVTAFVDTNVLIRHLTGDPPDQAARATAYLEQADGLLLPDLVVAEVVYVLRSYYDYDRLKTVELVQSLLLWQSIEVEHSRLLLRTLSIYAQHRLDFADAYLIASAEVTGVGFVASFDRDIERPGTVIRVEPR